MDRNEKTELVKEFVEKILFGWRDEMKEKYLFEVLHSDYMKLSDEDLIDAIEEAFEKEIKFNSQQGE
jgi:uncharacterized protein (DUF433 family)